MKKTKPAAPKVPVQYIPHAEQVCKSCGALGCLIPVPHGRSST